MAIRQNLITQEEAAKITGRSRRTITTWIKEGMATFPTIRNNRHVVLLDKAEVKRWAKKKQHGKTSKQAPPADTELDASNPDDLQEVIANLDSFTPDQIESTIDRVSRLEQALYQAAFTTMNTELVRAYKDVLAARRQIEKELPEILYRKGRYVDADQVGYRVAEAMHGVSSVLDTIGSNAAPLLDGKNIRDRRRIIDEQTAKAKLHIQEFLKGELER